MSNKIVVIGMALLLFLAPLGGVAGASSPDTTETTDPPELTSGEVYDSGHENVSIWDLSILTLQVDMNAAEYSLETPSMRASPAGTSGEIPLNQDEAGMFNTTSKIPLEFESSDVSPTDDLREKPATVIIGEADPSADLANFEMPTSIGPEELETLNDNMSFEEIGPSKFDEEGELSTEYEPDDAGQYVAIVATGEEEFSLLNEKYELDPEGESTIVGANGFVVHDDASEVNSPSEIEPGENATFDAKTGLDGDEIVHGVALYDEDELTDTDVTLNLTAEPDSELSSEDVTLETDLAGVNGVISVDDEERIEGETSFETLLEELNESVSDEIDMEIGDELEIEPDETYLNGSVTVNQTDSANAEIDVETDEDWSEGEYRWVHVAADSSGEFESSAEMMDIEADDDEGPAPGPGPSPEPPEEPDYRVSDATVSDAKLSPGESSDISATLQNDGEGTGPFTAELLIDGEVVDDQIIRADPGEEKTITFTHTFEESGEYSVAINDVDAGTVTVGDDLTEFDVSDATLSDSEIEAGESVDASATVTNTGADTGSFTAELLVDGDVVDTEGVTLAADDETTVEFSEQFDDAGEYDIAINDADAGTVTVNEADDGIPGFGPLAALLAIATSLLAIRFLPERS